MTEFHSGAVRAHSRVQYRGHAFHLPDGVSREEVLNAVSRVSTEFYSADCAPFAYHVGESRERKAGRSVIMEEEEEGRSCDDNGECTAGSILLSCLQNFEAQKRKTKKVESILLVVTRKVQGCFVVDSIQPLKYSAIRSCAMKALAGLYEQICQESQSPLCSSLEASDKAKSNHNENYNHGNNDVSVRHNTRGRSKKQQTNAKVALKTFPIPK